jgi:hypothetical protein
MIRLPCSKPTPAGLLAPDHYGAAAWPLVIERQRLPRLGLSTLNSMAFGLAVYASQRRLPDTTQDSLPVAGQALLDGVLTRKAPMKGFRLHLVLLSQALLGATDVSSDVPDFWRSGLGRSGNGRVRRARSAIWRGVNQCESRSKNLSNDFPITPSRHHGSLPGNGWLGTKTAPRSSPTAWTFVRFLRRLAMRAT